MTRDKVLLISFAPNHSSAVNRVHDCAGGSFDLEVYKTDADKVNESIASRIFSMKYPAMLLSVLRSDARVLWPWGLDACLVVSLAALLKPRTLLLWDISDINVHLLKPGWKARAMRAVERLLLKRADGLLLTSPAFYSEYFAGAIPAEKVAIIENLMTGTPPAEPVPPPPSPSPCVIVYSGILRSLEVVRLMCAVAREMPGEVVFHIHGYPDRTIGEAHLMELIAGHDAIHYHGPFKREDLAGLYAKAHLSWGFVDPEASINERWLLTNRIYNGVSFGRPVLTNADTTSGSVVAERRMGIGCEMEPRSIADAIRRLMADDWAPYRQLRAGMPPPASAHLDGNYARAIEALLANGRHAPGSGFGLQGTA